MLIAGVVFAETGLLVGLFFPGDSLLFTVGVVAGAGDLDIVRICVLVTMMSMSCPIRWLICSQTTMVPSSRYPIPCPAASPSYRIRSRSRSPGR